jgi:hypothetical protein
MVDREERGWDGRVGLLGMPQFGRRGPALSKRASTVRTAIGSGGGVFYVLPAGVRLAVMLHRWKSRRFKHLIRFAGLAAG